MTFAEYMTWLPVMVGFWSALDIVVFAVKKAVRFFKILSG